MMLYIHIPFCRSKCAYCSFFSLPLSDELSLNAYVSLLLEEINFWRRCLGRMAVDSVYFGGGTPSLLSLTGVKRIIQALDGAFSLQSGDEWSLEANPESCKDAEYLSGLKALGVNRLSLGLQSLDPVQLCRLGRGHDAAQGVRAFDLARWAGFENISVDLIWGLPGQRLRNWLQTLEKVLDLHPEHLSCYGLSVEQDTPLAREVASGKADLPTEDEQAKMFLQGTELLESKGYIQYETSNFSRMGYACRHNQGYWEGREYLGLGAGAVSTLGGRRWENPKALSAYARLVRSGQIGSQVQELTPAQRIKELVMLSLRTSRGLELDAYSKLSNRSFLHEHTRLIQVLRQNELIRISDGRLRLSKTGMLVSNAILERFL
jgi:oxygen-independent coproporphyrinogen-3 oxidase